MRKSVFSLTLVTVLFLAIGLFIYGCESDSSDSPDTIVQWTLVDVTFDDGGTASGTVDINMNTKEVLDWSVSVSGGNIADLPPFEYRPSTSTATASHEYISFSKHIPFSWQDRLFWLEPLSDLTSQLGTIPLNTLFDSSYECYNCSPYRSLVSGSLVGSIIATDAGQYPNIRGQYTGSYTIEVVNWMDPSDTATYTADAVFNITNQNKYSFSGSGTGTLTELSATENITIYGTVNTTGEVSGRTSSDSFLSPSRYGFFTGQLNGNTLTITNNGSDDSGGHYMHLRDITVTR